MPCVEPCIAVFLAPVACANKLWCTSWQAAGVLAACKQHKMPGRMLLTTRCSNQAHTHSKQDSCQRPPPLHTPPTRLADRERERHTAAKPASSVHSNCSHTQLHLPGSGLLYVHVEVNLCQLLPAAAHRLLGVRVAECPLLQVREPNLCRTQQH